MGNTFMRIAAVSLIGALMAGLSGCGGGSDPAPSTSPPTTPAPVPQTTSPAESASPDVAPTPETVRPEIDIPVPEKYEQMANDDIDGASTAARYFLDLYGYIYNTGDLIAWKKLSDEGCVKCSGVAEHVKAYYEEGQWFENFALLHGESTVYYPTADDPYYFVQLDVVAMPYTHYDAQGKVIETSTEIPLPDYGVAVRFIGPNEWKVVEASQGEIE